MNTENEFKNKMLTDYNSKEPDDNFRSVSRKRKRLNCSRRSGKLPYIAPKLFWTGPIRFGLVQIILDRFKLDYCWLILIIGPVETDLKGPC